MPRGILLIRYGDLFAQALVWAECDVLRTIGQWVVPQSCQVMMRRVLDAKRVVDGEIDRVVDETVEQGRKPPSLGNIIMRWMYEIAEGGR